MKTITVWAVLALLCLTDAARASHVVGMHITYEYMGSPNEYTFRLKLYRDCSGISAPNQFSINFTSVSCGLNFIASLQMVDSMQIPMNTCGGFGATTCQGGMLFGFEEFEYEGEINVPSCSDWVVSATVCCRNYSVTNITNADMYATYVETHFDNLNFPDNSSPAFSGIPMNYYCVGIPSMKDYSAFDVDGDSLRYELVPVMNDDATIVPFAPGYTYDQPLAAFTPTILDSLNGMLLFTPSSIQVSSLGYLVSEYRNGILIGTVHVEDEIIVATGIANPDTISGRVYIDYNANSVFDAGDQAVPNVTLQLLPGNLYTTTAGNGKYDFYTVDGIYDVTITNPPLYTTPIPSSININTNGLTFSGNNDFRLDLTPNMNDLQIYLYEMGNPVPGQVYPLQITYKNTGTTIQPNVVITLTLDTLLTFTSSLPPPSNIAGNTLTWNIASLPALTTGNIDILTLVDTSATQGTWIQLQASITSPCNDLTPANNIDALLDAIAASCDPNFKEVFPAGDLGLSFITTQEWLTYRIHFQNLGNAPAQVIRISDYLDPDLDYGSLEFIASSFPCTMTLWAPNHLQFSFFGINLPAASVDEPGSHGFVEFRIRPKASLQPGAHIANNAGIYFDFNAPVYTNLVQNLVVNTVGLADHPAAKNSVTLYPNPASGHCLLEYESALSGWAEITVYNFMGMEVRQFQHQQSPGTNRITLPLDKLTSGNYVVVVSGAEGYRTGRVSVTK